MKTAIYLIGGVYALAVLAVGNLVIINGAAKALGAPEWSPWAVLTGIGLTMGMIVLLQKVSQNRGQKIPTAQP